MEGAGRTGGNGRWKTWALGLSLLFNVGFAATFAYGILFPPPLPPEPEAVPEPPPRFRERLGLDETQWKELREKRRAMFGKVRDLRREVRKQRSRVWDMVASDSPDRDELARTTAAIADLQRQVQDLVVDQMISTRSSLEEEQRGRFDEFVRSELCNCPMCDGGCMGRGCRGGGRGPHGGPHGRPEGPPPVPVPPPGGDVLPPPLPPQGSCPGGGPFGGPCGCAGEDQ